MLISLQRGLAGRIGDLPDWEKAELAHLLSLGAYLLITPHLSLHTAWHPLEDPKVP